MKVNIHNQCSDFKLTDIRYFSSGARHNEAPAREVDAGNIMSFELTPFRTMFEGVLMCKLWRKDVESDNQPELLYTLLLMAWKSEGYKKFYMFVQLLECDKAFRWDEIKPKEYYRRYAGQLSPYTSPIKETWLLPDSTVLMTELELNFTLVNRRLNITISEGTWNECTKRPEWINMKR
jgi:hypothetical protein